MEEGGSEVGGSGVHFPLHPAGTPSESKEQGEHPMESQLIWSLEAKIIEDIVKQTVRRLCWDSKVPGTCAGTKAAAAPSFKGA